MTSKPNPQETQALAGALDKISPPSAAASSSPLLYKYGRYVGAFLLAARLALLFELHSCMWAVLYFCLAIAFSLTTSMASLQAGKDIPLIVLLVIQIAPFKLQIVQVGCLIMALICGLLSCRAMVDLQAQEQERLAKEEQEQLEREKAQEDAGVV